MRTRVVSSPDNRLRIREGFLPVAGAQLYFREVRNRLPPLLILHGGPDFNHNYLLPELDRLASAFRLIYYDQRGRGKSSSGVDPGTVSIDSEIDDLDRLRRHFRVPASAILGHSWGCVLAMEYATHRPDRVSHLILLNTGPASHADLLHHRRQRAAAEATRLARMRDIAQTPAYAEGDIETEAEYYRLHFGTSLRSADQLESLVGRLRCHFTPHDILAARAIEESLYAQTWSSPHYDLLARLRTLNVPTLLIHGQHDLIPLECARNVAQAIRGARLLVLADCGHFSYMERPGEVLDAIVSFFGSPHDRHR